jgi:hypothetical protein
MTAMLIWPGTTPLGRPQGTETMVPTELEQIDEKLKSYRAISEKEGRGAQWCRENWDSDPFKMNREREAHLLIKATADQEIVRLEFERRCAMPPGWSDDGGWKPATPGFYGSDH